MLFKSLLIIHIVAGFSALLLGAMAAASRKGSPNHITSGKWYVYCMYIVGGTAIVMTQLKSNTFLFTVGVFTLYLTVIGQRSIFYFRLKNAYPTRWIDKIPIILALIVTVGMIAVPIYTMVTAKVISVSVMIVFGVFLLVFAIRDLRYLLLHPIYQPGNKQWLLKHIGMISGAYIATLTAFLVTNVTFDPAWAVWLAPTAIGSFFIAKSTREWKRKLKLVP